jgi:hypothetical protein
VRRQQRHRRRAIGHASGGSKRDETSTHSHTAHTSHPPRARARRKYENERSYIYGRQHEVEITDGWGILRLLVRNHIVPQLAPWRARIDSSRRGLPLAGAEVTPGIETGPGRPAIGAEFWRFDVHQLWWCACSSLPAHCAPSAQTRA